MDDSRGWHPQGDPWQPQWHAESSSRSRAPLYAAALALAAAAVVAGVWFLGFQEPTSTATPPLHPQGAAPTSSATPVGSEDPFARSPVRDWLLGETAVVSPEAAPVAKYSAEQVADAYDKTRAYLLAAFLDPAVLYAGDVGPATAVLDPESVLDVASWVADPDEAERNPVWLVNRFHPEDVQPATPDVKVNGRMTAREDEDGLLAVDFDYVFVYAVRPAGGGAPLLVDVRRDGTLLFDSTPRTPATVSPAGWYRGSYINGGDRCGVPPQRPGFLAVWFTEPVTSTAVPKATYNPLDLEAGPAPDAECFENTSGLDG